MHSEIVMPSSVCVVETVEQQIVRQLTEKRVAELNESLMQTKEEYKLVHVQIYFLNLCIHDKLWNAVP